MEKGIKVGVGEITDTCGIMVRKILENQSVVDVQKRRQGACRTQ